MGIVSERIEKGFFDENKHPRVGGRFAPKGGGGGRQNHRLGRTGRREARRLAHSIGRRANAGEIGGRGLLKLRAEASHAHGGSTPDGWGKRPTPAQYPVEKWNALPDHRRLRLMREFVRQGGKLPGKTVPGGRLDHKTRRCRESPETSLEIPGKTAVKRRIRRDQDRSTRNGTPTLRRGGGAATTSCWG